MSTCACGCRHHEHEVEVQDTLAMHPEIEQLFKFAPSDPSFMLPQEKYIVDQYLIAKEKFGEAWEHTCPIEIKMAAQMIMFKYGIYA